MRLENAILNETANGAKPEICKVNHHFAPGIYCREFYMRKGAVITGILYKKEIMYYLVKGKVRVIDGNKHRDIEAPMLCRNLPGQKNGWCALKDSLLVGFIPNPNDYEDITEIMKPFSDDAEFIQGENNLQEKIARLPCVIL